MNVFAAGLLVSWMITGILVCCVIELFRRVKRLNIEISNMKGSENDVSK